MAEQQQETEVSALEVSVGRCSHCNGDDVAKLLWCSRCHKAAYCSKECQKSAWKTHKSGCKAAAAAAAAASAAAKPAAKPVEEAPTPVNPEGVELLECARYGELEELEACLKRGAPIDYTDSFGNTSLHRACANGHASVVQSLMRAGAAHVPNHTGNYPLHWAVQNEHIDVVRALLQSDSGSSIDVLARNGFGQGSLSNGFSSGNADIMQLLLEHSSATEERLVNAGAEDNTGEGDAEGEGEGEGGEKSDVKEWDQFFQLNEDGVVFCVREQAIRGSENPFESATPSADTDLTGAVVWGASVVLSRWLLAPAMRDALHGKSVVELGAGCALPALVAWRCCGAADVVATDLHPRTLANMEHNVRVNAPTPASAAGAAAAEDAAEGGQAEEKGGEQEQEGQEEEVGEPEGIRVMGLDWTAPLPEQLREPVDVVIGSDVVYHEELVPPLVATIRSMLKPRSGRFYYVAPDTGRAGFAKFLDELTRLGLKLVQSERAPPEMLANPIHNDPDGNKFILSFTELTCNTFTLYTFARED